MTQLKTFSLSDEIIAKLDELAGKGKQSEWIRDMIELAYNEQQGILKSTPVDIQQNKLIQSISIIKKALQDNNQLRAWELAQTWAQILRRQFGIRQAPIQLFETAKNDGISLT